MRRRLPLGKIPLLPEPASTGRVRRQEDQVHSLATSEPTDAEHLFYVALCCQPCWEAMMDALAEGRHLCQSDHRLFGHADHDTSPQTTPLSPDRPARIDFFGHQD